MVATSVITTACLTHQVLYLLLVQVGGDFAAKTRRRLHCFCLLLLLHLVDALQRVALVFLFVDCSSNQLLTIDRIFVLTMMLALGCTCNTLRLLLILIQVD